MKILKHKFVDKIPERIEDGIIYVSIPFETIIHKCCCGCGNEVVTPLSPTDWSVTFNGESVTLKPSIGNWSFDCKSHYWIKENRIIWSTSFDETEIGEVRRRDAASKLKYYGEEGMIDSPVSHGETIKSKSTNGTIWQKVIAWLAG